MADRRRAIRPCVLSQHQRTHVVKNKLAFAAPTSRHHVPVIDPRFPQVLNHICHILHATVAIQWLHSRPGPAEPSGLLMASIFLSAAFPRARANDYLPCSPENQADRIRTALSLNQSFALVNWRLTLSAGLPRDCAECPHASIDQN